MTDILARFDGNDAFHEERASWSDEATRAFCKIAQAAHDAGLDWWFVNLHPYELRCGRRNAGRVRATAVFGYVGGSGPWFAISKAHGARYLDTLKLPITRWGQVTKALADRVVALAAQQDFVDHWRFGAPARVGRWPDPVVIETETETDMPEATNLILHGPPGTGKTYATARHAVRLCGEVPSEDRAELMVQYRRLHEAERIEFITFHQSMSYEDFIEGLRPVPNAEGAGFTLQPRPGIFRRIAHAASINTGSGREPFRIGDRQVFKMSLGDAGKSEWAWVFKKAIAEGYAYLGFADIDWSDDRYSERKAIMDELRGHEGHTGMFGRDTPITLRAGPVKSPDIFRNEVQIGDVIIVGKGLNLFRAIGVVEGDYEYVPDKDSGEYSHRRRVNWLWHDNDGLPIHQINSKKLSLDTIYRLNNVDLNARAIEQLVNERAGPGPSEPEPYVLIIDEINRANISKVFGELITLIESDKRLGAENAVTVRLPYSEDVFGVPANLHIIGTMNTADRSIALIDKALRRRFDFEEMMPDYSLREMQTRIDGVTLGQILRTINARIEYLLDREHQIGHGWLIKCQDRAALDAVMKKKIIPLIAEYFFEDWERTAEILRGTDGLNPFLEKTPIAIPPGMATEHKQAHGWTVRTGFGADAYRFLVGQK